MINTSRVRQAVSQAFSLSPSLLALRDQLGGEAAQVWVQDGKGGQGLAGNNAGYLDYFGIDASPLTRLAPSTPAHTTITVYNGAETAVTQTINYLQRLYKVQVQTKTDPTVQADIVVVLGRDAKTLTIPTVG